MGRALLGRKVKDKVEIMLPMGKRRLKVVQFETVHDVAEGR